MSMRTLFGHTNVVVREFQHPELEDVLKETSKHVMDFDNHTPLSVNVFFDAEEEQWTVLLTEDVD